MEENNSFGDFCKAEFDLDDFLNKQTESNDLKAILYSLNEMKNKNANMMTTVLKEKTDAVILIAEQLQSLYKKIHNLQSPLAQLREEVHIITKRVHDTISLYTTTEVNYQNIREIKHVLMTIQQYNSVLLHTENVVKLLMNNDDIDFDELERFVCKYAFHAFIVKELHVLNSSSSEKKPAVDMPIKKILQKAFIKAYATGNQNQVTRIIDMFVFLGMLDCLREIIRENLIKPKILPVLCEANLRACGNDMSLVYSQALRVLDDDLKLLVKIIRSENVDLDVILDCYWNVVDKLLRTNVLSITAAGHPDAFFKHFNHTHQFLQEIGAAYGNQQLHKEHHSFIEHLKRFNLLVYYEIRHQYVSAAFELVVQKCSHFADAFQLVKVCRTVDAKQDFKLGISLALNVLVKYLFSDKVFMSIISEQFVKSVMLLVSRYSVWVREGLMTALRQFPRAQENVTLAVWLITDLQRLTEKITRKFVKIDVAIDTSIRSSLEDKMREDFATLHTQVAEYLVKYHISKMKDDLKNVSDIPRLYRKTNRSLPQRASSYVKDAFKEIKLLSASISTEHSEVMNQLLLCAIHEYNSMVRSVLNAVFKTEESLKRLKSRNVGSAETGALQGSSDEAKIRLQIKLDVVEFVQCVQSFKLEQLQVDLDALLVQIENC